MILRYAPTFINSLIQTYRDQVAKIGTEGLEHKTLTGFGSEELLNSRRFVVQMYTTKDHPGLDLVLHPETDFCQTVESMGLTVPKKMVRADFLIEVSSDCETRPIVWIVLDQVGDIIQCVKSEAVAREISDTFLSNHQLDNNVEVAMALFSDHERLIGYMYSVFGSLNVLTNNTEVEN